MTLRRLLVVAAIALGLTACLHTRAKPDMAHLRYRASLDLHCNEVTAYPAGARTQLVRGCGQEAVYIHDCLVATDRYSSHETNCTWRLDRQPGPIVSASAR
jgi:hypothetical protein